MWSQFLRRRHGSRADIWDGLWPVGYPAIQIVALGAALLGLMMSWWGAAPATLAVVSILYWLGRTRAKGWV